MAKAKLTSAPAKTRTSPAITEMPTRLEKERQRLFDAMNFVRTTEHALDWDSELAERETLSKAWKIMDHVAGQLEGIALDIKEAQS